MDRPASERDGHVMVKQNETVQEEKSDCRLHINVNTWISSFISLGFHSVNGGPIVYPTM